MLPRKRIFAGALVAALLLIFPLRVALVMVDTPITAPFVGGFLWGGRIVDARLGGLPLGDLRAGLSPLDLLIGRARIWIDGQFKGAVVSTFSGSGVDIEALNLPVSRGFGAVTLRQVDISSARIRFNGRTCSEASGRVQLTLAPSPLLGNQAGRYTGSLQCDGDGVSSLLVSQSAMERLALRIGSNGGYTATLVVKAQDDATAAALRAAGFRDTAGGFSARLSGTF